MPSTPWLTPEIIVALIGLAKGLIWPAVLSVFVFVFKDDIRKMIPRIRKAGTGGLELEPEKAQQQSVVKAEELSDRLSENEFKRFGQERITETLIQVEASIRRDINSDVENGIVKYPDRLDYVIRHLAAARIERHFFRVYNYIFGSQIAALYAIKQTSVAPAQAIRQIFDNAKEKDPDFYGDYPFEEWVRFLVTQELVVVEPGAIRITPAGEDFLTFMQHYKLPAFKRG